MVHYSSAFLLLSTCALMFFVCRAEERFLRRQKELATKIDGELDREIYALIQQDNYEESAQRCSLEAEQTNAAEQKAFLLRRAKLWMHKAEQLRQTSS
jgi:hypothetical protein